MPDETPTGPLYAPTPRKSLSEVYTILAFFLTKIPANSSESHFYPPAILPSQFPDFFLRPMEEDPKVSRPCWICTTVVSSILFIAFILITLFLNRSHWPRVFLSLIAGAFGFCHQWSPVSFTHSIAMIGSHDFVNLIHFFVTLVFATLFFAVIDALHSSYDSRPLFGIVTEFSPKQDPVGLALALGAFVFGIGMQMASGCAIGTVVGLGEGFLKSWMAVVFVIVGATVGICDPVLDWFGKMPATAKPVTIPWYATLAILVVIVGVLVIYSICRVRQIQMEQQDPEFSLQDAQVLMILGYDPEREARMQPGYRLRLWRNYAIDLVIAALLALFFLCEGRPISIIPGLAEAGSWILRPCGADTRLWKYWDGREMPDLLKSDAFLSVVFVGLGAFLASSFGGNFGLYQEGGPRHLAQAVVGGFAMGFGGMVAGGGNLLGIMGGVASSSVAGFVWLACAVAGALVVVAIGTYIKRRQASRDPYTDVG
jgi:uncharacterized membrane protein YedE/YeeE